MDKKQLIKTIITVLPVFLVPLIVERKRIKDHPDVKKATDATVSASKTVANKSVQFKDSVVEKSSHAKDYVADKKHNVDQKRELKRIAKAYDPAYIEKKGERLEKENRKDIKKLDKLLQKNIDKRHKEEDKAQEKNKKNRLSEFKKYKDYVAKSVVKQNNEDKGK
ncbi:hypothetical protein CD110_13370 [Staphylococcus casei]|uniref:hypothetical protein n=1 Tax=Staphylococcus casei TaxID=201828 RepID=UPI000CD13481|nr:hypothetical protein [Staphylococcus casei]PNZ56697.1 hypothetical protein CD110_13370 [Staphylococcus casei]WJE85913.1 hypothetical protein QMO72_10895 [Staphylococcus casei]